MLSLKQRRNDACACGSGAKFKNCCALTTPPSYVAPSPAELGQLLSLYNEGRYAELESLARPLLERYPDAGYGWKLLGGALLMQGKDTLEVFQKVVVLRPNDAEAHFNLGVVLSKLGRLDDAAASYRLALDVKQDYAEALSNLGGVLNDLGQFESAAASYRRALKINPDSAESHNNLGVSLSSLGQLGPAYQCYQLALQLNPEYAEAYNNLGNILKRRGNLAGAMTYFRHAIAIKPGFAKVHSALGSVLRDLQQFGAAETSFRSALAIDPECNEAVLGLGSMILENGEMEEAEALFQRALKINPDNIEARFGLTRVKSVQPDDENFAALLAIETAVQNDTLQLQGNGDFLNFALGKCFDDMGVYNRAFPCFVQGCNLKRATIEYSAAQTTQYVNDIIRVFDRATVERLRGGANVSNLPIFVLGLPRSGTTLIEQIIASHNGIFGAGELTLLRDIAHRDATGTGVAFPDNIPALKSLDAAKWVEDYVDELRRYAPEALRITDKMPTNFFAIGLIHALLPNAKIIHVKRNPLDTCLSSFTHLFKNQLEYTYDFAELGQYYVDYVRLMEHWHSVLPAGAFIEVQYEEVVADLEGQARRIMDFCGLEWEEDCIDFHKNKRAIRTASVTQVRHPIYRTSVVRWRHYEKFLGPLLDALGNLALGLCMLTAYQAVNEIFWV